MTTDPYDVAIIGAGPAGSSAAILLAQKARQVVLVDRATFPRNVPCAGWLSARSIPLLEELGLDIKSLRTVAFRDVTFHRADFTQAARPVFRDPPGVLVDRFRLDDALVEAARRLGVNVISGCAATDIRLEEAGGVVDLADGRTLRARLFLIASGRASELVGRVGITVGDTGSPIWAAQVEAPLKGSAAPNEPRISVVLGLDQAGSFALACTSVDRVSIGIHWHGDRSAAVSTLVYLCRQLAEHNIVPVDLSGQARSATLLKSPASVALDMESHVGKHTLVIGDAGGFVAAVSNEGLYPAMWSARIAVDVLDRALGSVHSQDALIGFDAAWRMQMADYLRPPHTDMQFLLPLIFTNQPMADRMGAAFFCGENI